MYDDFSVQKLLTDVEKLLSEVSTELPRRDLDSPPNWTSPVEDGPLNGLESTVDAVAHGFLDIEISDDLMTAHGDFYPPAGAGQPLTLEAVEAQIQAAGITWGVHWPLIKEALSRCNLNLVPVKGILIAAGLAAEAYLPERWEIGAELLEKKRQLDSSATFLDFKTISPFIYVKQNQVLAAILPERPGCDGHNLHGEALPFHRDTPTLPQPGPLVVRVGAEFRAASNGCFYCTADQFWVEKVLLLPEGVSYKTGHIDFDGDVQIQGEVAPGFKVRAKGAIHSAQVLDATEVVALGDVTSAFGIIGRKDGVVRSDRRVRAKFLENLLVVAKGSVEVQSSVMNCTVQTLDRLQIGPKGWLAGGRIEAQNGVSVHQVGNTSGLKTEIICGIDHLAKDKILWIRDQNLKLGHHLQRLRLEMQRHPETRPSLLVAEQDLTRQIQDLVNLGQNLLGQVDRNDNAEITVNGTIYPGNYLEICHVSLVVSQPLTRVKFFLDKQRGILAHAPL